MSLRRAFALGLLLLSAAPARASEAEARAAYAEARAHYEAGRYAEALDGFTLAWQLSGKDGLLLNVALCWEQLGEPDRARESLARLRAEASPEELAAAGERLTSLEQRLGLPAGAATEPAPDAEPDPEPATDAEPDAEPAPDAEPDPEPATDAEPDPEPAADAAPQPDAGPPPALAVPSPALRPRWGMVAMGATTAVACGTTAALTWRVSREWLETGQRAPYVALRPVNHAALGLTGLGAGLVAMGLLVGDAPPLSLSPSLTPGGATLTLSISR